MFGHVIKYNKEKKREKKSERPVILSNICTVIAICCIATVISLLLDKVGIGKENLLMIFLMGVLISTITTTGYVYGFLTSIISMCVFNCFFTEPKYTLKISNKEDILLLVFFMLTALIGGYLSSYSRHQADIARQSEKNAQMIYEERNKIALAIEAERLKSTLLRSVSHDIRTPLTGIMGASSTIIDNYSELDEKVIKELAQDINEESAWLIMTVQNILDMTRITEGNLTIKKDFEAVDDLIVQVVSRVSFLTKKNRLQVKMPDEIILVEVDGKLFVQVLFNLLDNAYKHSGENSTVTLSVETSEEEVVFTVSDNGNGIDKSIQDNLFQEFVTPLKHSEDKGRGVGLGLSICKAIVLAHDGKITAHNNENGGAVFTIKLPYKED